MVVVVIELCMLLDVDFRIWRIALERVRGGGGFINQLRYRGQRDSGDSDCLQGVARAAAEWVVSGPPLSPVPR